MLPTEDSMTLDLSDDSSTPTTTPPSGLDDGNNEQRAQRRARAESLACLTSSNTAGSSSPFTSFLPLPSNSADDENMTDAARSRTSGSLNTGGSPTSTNPLTSSTDHLTANLPPITTTTIGPTTNAGAVANPNPTATKGGSMTLNAGPSQNFIQTTLTGTSSISNCDICKMTFNNTLLSERRNHNKHHADLVDGLSLAACNLQLSDPTMKVTVLSALINEHGHENKIVRVTNSSHIRFKDFVERIQADYICDEPALSFPVNNLWTSIAFENQDEVDKFTVFLSIQPVQVAGVPTMPRVVGALIAEKITKSFEVDRVQMKFDEDGEPWPSIVVNLIRVEGHLPNNIHKAYLGVKSLWVHDDHRRKGIATRLLDEARKNLIHGRIVERDEIAFANLTEGEGEAFAASWYNPEFLDLDPSFKFLEYFDDWHD